MFLSKDTITEDSAKIDYLLTTAWNLARTNPTSGITLLQQLEQWQSETPDSQYKIDVRNYYFGVIHKNLGQFAESLDYFKKYYEYHKALDHPKHLAVVTLAMANLYSDQGLYNKSAEAVTESLERYESLNDTSGMIRTNGKLGYVLLELNRIEAARTYHRKALALATQINFPSEIAISNSNLGLGFEKEQQLDSALVYYQRAKAINERENDKWGLVYDNNSIGIIYLKKEQYQTALPYTKKAFELANELGGSSLISFSSVTYGQNLLGLGQTEQGLSLLQEELHHAQKTNASKDLRQIHYALYEGYKEQENVNAALYHHELFHNFSDSMFNQNIAQQINNLEVEYQTNQTRQELALIEAQQQLTEIKLKSSRRWTFVLVATLLLFATLIAYFWNLNRTINRQKNIIATALDEKNVLLKEIHHRVKNNLQVISSLLNLQSKHTDDPLVLDALSEGKNRVKSMALIHQKLYQEDNLTGINTKEYFEKLISSLFDSYNINADKVELQLHVDDVNLDVDSIIPLGLIANELVSNALKHAFPDDAKGVLNVSLKEQGNTLLLRVADNGSGMTQVSEEELKQSFGHRLIRIFQKQLDANLFIESSNGTIVEFIIHNYQKVA